MKFRDDIDIDNTWVVSDTHFGHDNIVGFCHRPEDHEQVMLAEWRAAVPDDGTVLHLGDLTYKSNARFRHVIVPELTGARKLLILGNHDRQGMGFYRKCGFSVVKPFQIPFGEARCPTCVGTGSIELSDSTDESWWDCVVCDGSGRISGTHAVSFSHYPWNTRDEGKMPESALRIHGHIHNNGYTRDGYVPFLKNHINLSVEQTKYRPVNLGLLLRGALLDEYPETTEEQLAEARARKDGKRD